MLERFRGTLAPFVTTIAIAVFGATALAVSPEIIERLGDDSQTSPVTGVANQDSNVQEDEGDNAANDDSLTIEDLTVEQMVGDEDGTTPTATVTATAKDEPNHGHFVSCIAHTAKNDPDVQGREKGKIVSAAARSDGELAKGESCENAYAALKQAVLTSSQEQEAEPEDVRKVQVVKEKPAGPEAKQEARPKISEVEPPKVKQENEKPGPPSEQGPKNGPGPQGSVPGKGAGGPRK